jgi:hypothetical protein
MMEAYGVIEGRAKPFDHRDFSACVHGGAKDDFLEEIARQMLGAGEGQQQPAGVEVFERVKIEKLISSRRRVKVASFVRERRRIQDDQIKSSLAFF